ncbi:MAG: hypothetical protein GF317_20200, partial [Candidatus Lokiarchaeota archaeon]|nr:hypothetical protein [Candidatus Lokiarchaeota archaeon]MBD3201805.1 hypothetical protein [Candidatus Lokiarchaeota archaeon]
MPSTKKFELNKYLTLKLEKGKTNIYVNGEEFRQCKFLLLNIPVNKVSEFDEIESIDEAAERLDRSMEGEGRHEHKIPPETEFWGHCSNLQVWYEHYYDTRLLHSNLAFPLLEKLANEGDPLAKRVFKEEIVKRLNSGYPNVITYLLKKRYLERFSKEERDVICEKFDFSPILNLNYEKKFPLLKQLYNSGVITARKILKKEIKKRIKSGELDEIIYIIRNLYLEEFPKEERDVICEKFDFSPILNLNYGKKFPLLKQLYNSGVLTARKILKKEFKKIVKSGETYLIGYILKDRYLEGFSKEEIGVIFKEFEKLELYLDSYDLKTLPESIGTLTSLKELNLIANKITTLPESIGNLNALKELNLSANKITTLPESIGNLTSLKELDLRSNDLKTLPESIGNLTSLEYLYLMPNDLKTLPESIGNLTSLKKLYLGHKDLSTLSDTVKKLKKQGVLIILLKPSQKRKR